MTPLSAQLLKGRRLLFVQEESHLSPNLREDLVSAAVEILGPTASNNGAQVHLAERRVDGAILDLCLDLKHVLPLVDALVSRGIPFVFATSALHLEAKGRYLGFVLCRKPVYLDEIAMALFGDEPAPGSA